MPTLDVLLPGLTGRSLCRKGWRPKTPQRLEPRDTPPCFAFRSLFIKHCCQTHLTLLLLWLITSKQAMERGGVSPDKGPVLVSGATGGVGGVATIILSQVKKSSIQGQLRFGSLSMSAFPIAAGLSCRGNGWTE